MNARALSALVAALSAVVIPVATANQTLETARRTNGPRVQAVFEPVRATLQQCSAVIQRGRKEIAYGTVITADGYILTKASELGDASGLSVTVGETKYPDPQLVTTDPVWDVALLKISAQSLTPVSLALDQANPERGTWVVANGATTRANRRVQVGIISASAREIPFAGGPVLGITFEEKDDTLLVTDVSENSGAADAGVRKGDTLLSLDGEAVTDAETLSEAVSGHSVGDIVPLVVSRDGEKMDLKVKLKGRVEVFEDEPTRNDVMSGRYSARRSGFPRVIQHDIIADPQRIGGPVLDLDGRCLGMNIARANRCETFAIPATDLKSLADRLLSQAK